MPNYMQIKPNLLIKKVIPNMKKIAIILLALAFALPSGSVWAALTKTQVSQLYIGVFGRASEGEGNSYWQTDPSSTSMTATANIMLNTAPAKTYFGSTLDSNQLFIEHIYANTLGKTFAEDPGGVNYWVLKLDGGISKGEVIAALITSAQDPVNAGAAQNRFNNKVTVSNHCADTIAKYTDLDTFTGFISSVTDDTTTVTAAYNSVDSLVPSDTTDSDTTAGDTTAGDNDADDTAGTDTDSSSQQTTYSDDDTSTTSGNRITKILFIGNSYTSSNDLPNIISKMASSVNVLIEYDQYTPGGARFSTHKDNATTISKIQSQDWDYVVLQNQSQVPGWKPTAVRNYSLPHAQTLVALITGNNPSTKIIYFQTWGRENGDYENCAYYPLVCTFGGHTQALKDGYNIYESNTVGIIAPVGEVWQVVVNDAALPFSASDLWSGDGSHPDILGSYLASLTIFSTIFNVSPEEITYDADLDEADVSYLKEQVALFLGY